MSQKFFVIEFQIPTKKVKDARDITKFDFEYDFEHKKEGDIELMTREELIDKFFCKYGPYSSRGFVLKGSKWIRASELARKLQTRPVIPRNSVIRVGDSYVSYTKDNKVILGYKGNNNFNFIDIGEDLYYHDLEVDFNRLGWMEIGDKILCGNHVKDYNKTYVVDKKFRYGDDKDDKDDKDNKDVANTKFVVEDDSRLSTLKRSLVNRRLDVKYYLVWNNVLYNLEFIKEEEKTDSHVFCKLEIG